MNNYVNTLTNSRGDSLPGYRVQVLNSTGTVIDIFSDKSGTRFRDTAGAVINYATAAPNGKVEFYFTAAQGQTLQVLDPAGSLVEATANFADNLLPDASLVSFQQIGTGAVERNVRDKAREVVTPEDFGAVGNGSGNDAAVLQAALNSGAKVVRWLNGANYRVTSAITVPAGVFIEAIGATLTVAHNGKGLIFTDGGGIRGGVIVGPGGAVYLAGSIGIDCRGTSNSPAAPTYVAAPVIEGVEVSDFGEYGIRLQYVRGGSITRPYVHDCGYTGIGGLSCEDVITASPRIYDIGPGSAGGDAYGWFFDRMESGASETSDPRSYRCSIIDADIQRVVATGGNGQGIDTHAGVDIQVIGGRVLDCNVGLAFTGSNVGGVATLAPIRCKAIGVTIKGGHNGYGAFVSGGITGSTVNAYAEDCSLTNVTIDGHGLNNTTGVGGLLVQGTTGLAVSGCTFARNAWSAMYLNFGNIGLSITGNSFIDPHDTAFTATSCILVAGPNNRGYIGDNVYRYADSGLATYVAVNSVRIEAALSGLGLTFGPSQFEGIDATHLTFLPLTTSGVNFSGLVRASGVGTISVTNTGANGITDVSFPKRFPYAPKVNVSLAYPSNGGGKRPIIGVDETGVIPTATGFRIYAEPFDGTTWTATGTLRFAWTAE